VKGAGRRLQDLDRRVVPRAARHLRAAVDGAGRARSAVSRRARGAARWTGRADDRLAGTGPLALLRDVPQVALLIVAAVFLAAAATAVYLQDDEVPRTIGAPVTATARTLGVPDGAPADAHLARARALVEQLADRRPDARYLALVSLDRHLPATEVAAVLAGTDPARLYLQAPGLERAETVEVPLAGTSLDSVLPPLCAATAARRTEDGRELRTLAATIEGTTPDEVAQRDDYLAEAVRAEAEAAAYGGPCTTAFAAVVEGEAQDLAGLLDRDAVRGVEVAPAGARLADVDVEPLVPGAP
jgi:hypothetical protein